MLSPLSGQYRILSTGNLDVCAGRIEMMQPLTLYRHHTRIRPKLRKE